MGARGVMDQGISASVIQFVWLTGYSWPCLLPCILPEHLTSASRGLSRCLCLQPKYPILPSYSPIVDRSSVAWRFQRRRTTHTCNDLAVQLLIHLNQLLEASISSLIAKFCILSITLEELDSKSSCGTLLFPSQAPTLQRIVFTAANFDSPLSWHCTCDLHIASRNRLWTWWRTARKAKAMRLPAMGCL